MLLKSLVSCLFVFFFFSIFSLSIINYFGSNCTYDCIKHIINVAQVFLDFVVIYIEISWSHVPVNIIVFVTDVICRAQQLEEPWK